MNLSDGKRPFLVFVAVPLKMLIILPTTDYNTYIHTQIKCI